MMKKINIENVQYNILKYFEKETIIKFDYLEYSNKNPNKENLINIILPGNILWSLPPDVIFEIKKEKNVISMILSKDKTNVIDLSNETIDKFLIIELIINISYNKKIEYSYLFESYLFINKYLNNSKIYLDHIFNELKTHIIDDNYDKLNLICLNPKYAIMIANIYLNKHLIDCIPDFIDNNILNILIYFPYTLRDVYLDLLKNNIFGDLEKIIISNEMKEKYEIKINIINKEKEKYEIKLNNINKLHKNKIQYFRINTETREEYEIKLKLNNIIDKLIYKLFKYEDYYELRKYKDKMTNKQKEKYEIKLNNIDELIKYEDKMINKMTNTQKEKYKIKLNDIDELIKYEDKMTNKQKVKNKILLKLNTINKIKYLSDTNNIEELITYEDKIHKKYLIEINENGVEYITIKSVMDDLYRKPSILKHVLEYGTYIKRQYLLEYGHLPNKIEVFIDNKYTPSLPKVVNIYHYTLNDYRFLFKCIRNKFPSFRKRYKGYKY